jgi:3',5'-cyclic AMP phosphodiesterase CpdA
MILIAQISDLHLRPRGLPALGFVDTNALTRRAVATLLALRPSPAVVLVTGDIADTGDPREYAMAREILSALPMPVHVIPGNHDRRAAMREGLAGTGWIGPAGEGAINYAVDVGPLRLVCLDSLVEGRALGELGADTLAWLDATLAAAPDRPTVVALHHPPFRTGLSHMDAILLRDGAAMEAVVRRHPQVGRVVCGHVHRAITTGFGGTLAMIVPGVAHQVVLDLADTSTALFVMEPPAYLVHTWTPETGFVSHLNYVERFPGPYDFGVAEGATRPGS